MKKIVGKSGIIEKKEIDVSTKIVYISKEINIINQKFTKNLINSSIEEIYFEEGSSLEIIDEFAFSGMKSLKSINLPEGLKKIRKSAFYKCENLELVKLHEGLKIIWDNAFECCYKLKWINLPNSLKAIGEGAFYACESLRALHLPKNLLKISGPIIDTNMYPVLSIDSNCDRELWHPDWAPTYLSGSYKLHKIDDTTSTFVNEGIRYIKTTHGVTVFCVEEDKEVVRINSTVNFKNKKYKVTYLGKCSFSNLNNLRKVIIDSSVFVSDYTFCNCTNLESVILTKNAKVNFNFTSFLNCPRLKQFCINNGEYVFNEMFIDTPNVSLYTNLSKKEAAKSKNGYTDIDGKFIQRTNYSLCQSFFKTIYYKGSWNLIDDEIIENEISDDPANNFEYLLIGNDKVIINSYYGSEKQLTIPSYVNINGKTCAIVAINVAAFSGNHSIESVILSDGIIAILDDAFSNCSNLKEIILPDTLHYIGLKVFYDTGIRSIFIPKSVSIIKAEAFGGSTKVYFEAINQSFGFSKDWYSKLYSKYSVFWGVTKDEYLSKENLDMTPKYRKQELYLNDFDYKESIKFDPAIHDSFFDESKVFSVGDLKYLIIDDDKVEISFCNEEVTDVEVQDSIELEGKTYKIVGVREFAFYNHQNLKSIKFGNNVEYIKQVAFSFCTNLKTIEFNNAKSIAPFAFAFCNSLEYIYDFEKVISIMDFAFASCGKLCSIDFGNELLLLGKSAFQNNISLRKVILPMSLLVIGKRCFTNCENLNEISIPKTTQIIRSKVFPSRKAVKICFEGKEPGEHWNDRWACSGKVTFEVNYLNRENDEIYEIASACLPPYYNEFINESAEFYIQKLFKEYGVNSLVKLSKKIKSYDLKYLKLAYVFADEKTKDAIIELFASMK